ncbi:hypothetical protein HEP86_19520 [Streptomyces sp. RPA4-5]|uniref:hypothetical protein n=1 Tax=Streptomyces sp. RPA4-5 TaxID=2721245 RepID=UPI00143E6476|nr:hypothetical protein [Streptomyces sp. RPA4-5]QIY53169.1 hypothetical protein HEP86_19520 [Streptomyces sp. RPA4-5]
MSHRIQVALERALVRITELFFPLVGGRHRAAPGTRPPRPTRTSRTSPRTPAAPRRQASAPRPRATSPADAPVLDGPSPLVRPYLLAHEQHARRAALALALDGIDVGPSVIHGHLVGTPGTHRPVMAGVAA